MHLSVAGKLTGPTTKWLVLVAWIAIAMGSGAFASKLTSVQNNEAASWLPASAESAKALDKLAAFSDPQDIPTVVVYHRAGGLTDADFTAIAAQATKLAGLDGVVKRAGTESVFAPTDRTSGQQAGVVSADGQVATSSVTFNFGNKGWSAFPDAAKQIRAVTHIPGVDVHLGGPGGQAADAADAFGGIDGKLLYVAFALVVLILLFTYRSPILWLLPILSSVVALVVAQGVVYLLAKYADLTVNGQSQAIMSILVIGAGTDYALLLVARYREELRKHVDRHEAMAFALHRAAPALFASAATVVLGMLVLLLASMSSTASLGPVMAVSVVVTVLVMLTLLPALLVIAGRWMFWPTRPTFGSREPTASGFWAKVGTAISRRPRRVWIVTTGLLAAACLGNLLLHPGTMPTEDQYTKKFDSVTAQQILVQHQLVDTSTPIQIVAHADQADAVVAALREVPGLGAIDDSVPPQDGTKFITIQQGLDPASDAAAAQVTATRKAVHAVPGAGALVTGSAALFMDISDASKHDNLLIIPVVLLVVLLILMLLLRSLLAPLLLIGTVVLSFGAALGLSTLIFRGILAHVFSNGDGFQMADSSFPLFAFVFLVALGIDYNIFLMTRVREETQSLGTRAGSLVALSSTGGVITSAGLVLAATFIVLGTLPVVFLAELGLAVALGVILDTMIVRSVLVTAVNLDLGGRIWWPSKLDRTPARTQETGSVTV